MLIINLFKLFLKIKFIKYFVDKMKFYLLLYLLIGFTFERVIYNNPFKEMYNPLS